MLSQNPKQNMKQQTSEQNKEDQEGMALGPSQTAWERAILVLRAAQMSHALVSLTTNLALTLTMQAITVGPSSQFCCGSTYLQES